MRAAGLGAAPTNIRDRRPQHETKRRVGKFLSGATVGAALSFLYLVYGYQPPEMTRLLDIPKEATALAMNVVADSVLYDPAANLKDQQRAIAFKIGVDPSFFQEIDGIIDNRFTNTVLHRRASRQAGQLRSIHTALDKIFDHPALRKHYEERYGTTDPARLKAKMLIAAIRDEPFLYQYLTDKYPDESDDQLAGRVLEIPPLSR